MAHLDHKGPDGEGPKTGRKLGRCKKTPKDELEYELGKGMGKRRNVQDKSCSGNMKRENTYNL